MQSSSSSPDNRKAELQSLLGKDLARALGLPLQRVTCIELSRRAIVRDHATLFQVEAGTDHLFLQLSPPDFPHVAKDEVDKAGVMKAVLGVDLANVILEPVAQGWVEGRSYVAVPFRKSLGTGIYARFRKHVLLRPRLSDWLVAVASINTAARPAAMDAYARGIKTVIDWSSASPELAHAARGALERLAEPRFEPRMVPMHGDFWHGNVLRAATGGKAPFTLIDWRGSEVRGFPIMDLVRFASSFRLSPAALRRELLRHCKCLGWSVTDSVVPYLAAVGFQLERLDQASPEMFSSVVHDCYSLLRSSLD